MTIPIRAVFWFGFYLFLLLLPLVVGAVARQPGEQRALGLEFAVACGYVGLAIISFEFALIARVQSLAGAFGEDALQLFHRQMGYVATMFILAHPIFLFLNGYPWTMLSPFSGAILWMWRWGIIAFWGLLSLVLITVVRKHLKISYEWWHVLHRGIALLVVPCALVHVVEVGHYSHSIAMECLWGAYIAMILAIVIRYRILGPIKLWRKAWEVSEIIAEQGNARTLVLHPIGHDGFDFDPGQFAWLNLGKTPFHFEQHPISISSSAEKVRDGSIAFTIKALGDWSGKVVPAIKLGARIWVDGPYGVFSSDLEQGPGYVLIGGGAGITPLRSMCETMAMREDNRPVVLFYGSQDYEDITFRQEFEQLKTRMNLKIVYVLQEPHSGWEGEKGHINAEMLRKHLPRQFKRFQYFICGPPLLMDSMEKVLPAIGVPPELVHTERFEI
jgi:predicted ferric reductase